jgi:hypothetical protein
MRTVASAFAVEMRRISDYIDLVVAVFGMAKLPLTPLRCKKGLAGAIADSHTKARFLRLGDSLAFEGAYLTACALFEEAVRDVIDLCASLIVGKKASYADLPEKMKKAHLEGCVGILRSPKDRKFIHLPAPVVIARLATCYCSPPPPAYSVITEVFSSHTSNFRSEVLGETIGKVGVDELWKKLGREPILQAFWLTAIANDATRFSTAKLDSIMTQRNLTIHRGTGFAAPTDVEVKECANFFAALIDALANVLDAYVAGL